MAPPSEKEGCAVVSTVKDTRAATSSIKKPCHAPARPRRQCPPLRRRFAAEIWDAKGLASLPHIFDGCCRTTRAAARSFSLRVGMARRRRPTCAAGAALTLSRAAERLRVRCRGCRAAQDSGWELSTVAGWFQEMCRRNNRRTSRCHAQSSP